MNIVAAAPVSPSIREPNRPRHDWSPLIAAVTAAPAGTWLRIAHSDLPGETAAAKQQAVHQILRKRLDGRFQTQTEGEALFLHLLPRTETN